MNWLKTPNMLKEEQRVIIKFLVKLGDGGGNILKKLRTVYRDGALKAMVVYKQVARYKERRESLEDDLHLGRPVSTHNNENVKHVDELLATNRRIMNHYIAETLRINEETVQLIIAEDLRMRQLCSRIVPKPLTA